jgi:ABC-type multidrug transport system fused ATPase/permease subunit
MALVATIEVIAVIVVTFVGTIVVTFVGTIVVTFVGTIAVTIVVIFVVTITVIGEGIVAVLVVAITHIIGLQGVHHTVEAMIIHHNTHPMLEGLGGRDLGPYLSLLIAQREGMLVDLGEMWFSLPCFYL